MHRETQSKGINITLNYLPHLPGFLRTSTALSATHILTRCHVHSLLRSLNQRGRLTQQWILMIFTTVLLQVQFHRFQFQRKFSVFLQSPHTLQPSYHFIQ